MGSPLRGRSRASCQSPTAWAPLLLGCWLGEYSLGSTPGTWPGLRYATTAQLKSSVKTGLAERSAEQWMLFPISQLEHLTLGAVYYITCPGHFLGTGVMEQVFPVALSCSPRHPFTTSPITAGRTTCTLCAELPRIPLPKPHHLEISPRTHRIALKT